ncbi:MAG: hypothetical protein KDC31_09020 [Saprospiraceae bacterium]|jgi:16S rRNA C967 or C1407 C5-methylase (RsmB/RsmF family)/NOL1/NOP2/fmu family ribosome biogenesis protein|nr:hypothetical protein [Saprospiraceae bacterium]MBX7178389.1 hypothetical protein [Saprospiraceae bacterium]MCB0591421.1 hypothetical protein [Saprospiraceae bacterium]MCO5283664.1 hypothetical protein [Saprospiraceae bacterium]MCO6469451.1 hypothetical protein [Saprospiraceae bacterium]
MPVSLPEEFIIRMREHLQEDYHRFANALNDVPPVSIRLNQGRHFTIPERSTPCPWEPNAYYLKERPSFTYDPNFHSGAYYVQEASSMIIGKILDMLDKSSWHLIIDLCAAPGGKTTHILDKCPESVFVLANESVKTRLGSLKHNLIKWGRSNCAVISHPVENIAATGLKADLVLVDAPCSGEGLFRKDKESVKHWSEKNLGICQRRQEDILHHIPGMVKEAGYLIYSTCTFNPKENIEQLNKLVKSGYFKSLPINLNPEWGIEEILGKGSIGYQCYPHRVKGEGFFFSLLQRTEKVFIQSNNKKFHQTRNLKKIGKEALNNIPDGLKQFADQLIIDEDFTIHLLPLELQALQKTIQVKPLFELGTLKGKDFIPSHPLTMLEAFGGLYPRLELTQPQAIQFLKKEELQLDSSPEKSWYIVTFNANPLGLIKVLEGRINNYYPGNYRILK